LQPSTSASATDPDPIDASAPPPDKLPGERSSQLDPRQAAASDPLNRERAVHHDRGGLPGREPLDRSRTRGG
jgi:hypothetical protein